jgi:DNA replication initiation complex subunit (GINS family)
MNYVRKSLTLTKKETELFTGLINAMETARDNLITRFDDLKTELETRAEEARSYDGEDDAMADASERVASSISHSFLEWQDKLKSTFDL